ncbi:signal peptide peptidase SppA [Staphylococcus sp. 18_1_E_LY]|uniref:Signal peptide peptidase SppA n=1 Tax=Staphylococcus lloydii TaxID=2781774 RepID=A0A7T1B1T9_9STAP|nr:signal peptide peptidase SppA [Staphylococcus lloydii]MBF7018441.1 signal peptide peptidase SppA [Staphylococcus lloydii]MBF7026169.1 signal peptide peptidase SppA [Staphylococcus lloydii]QPM76190.1 signal peptide peptidase SppA [Staphylococcus lloydii]
MSKKRVIAIILAVVVILGGITVSSISAIVSSFISNSSSSNVDPFTEETEQQGSASKRIAHLTLNGEISDESGGGLFGGSGYDHDAFMKQLDNVKKDKSVKGVLLTVNSPGGGTYPSDEIYNKIKQIKKKGKKVYVHMESLAASGGYYVSAPADKIYAGPQSMVGSIGVIMSNVDYSGLQKKLGIKENVIKSGAHKDILSSSRPMTSDEKNILQSMLNDSFDRFINIVKNGRHMSEKKVRKLADGRVYSAQQAKENGLIDNIGYQNEALTALKKDIHAKNAEVFEYSDSVNIFSTLFSAKSTIKQFNSDIKGIKSVITNDSKAKPMYLYEG